MRLRTYEISVAVASVGVLAYAIWRFGVTDWETVLFLGALAILAEWFAVDLAVVGSVSLTFAIIFAAVVLGGPADGAIVAAIGSISFKEIAQGKPLERMAFNSGQYIILTFVAGLVQAGLGMSPLFSVGATDTAGWLWLAGGFVVAASIAGMNMLLVGVAISLYTEMPLARVWRESFRSYSVSLVVLALLGMVLAQLIHTAGIGGTFLLVIPFAIARQTFQVYTQQSGAYRDTVRSLVAVLEAKDPYTRGHSERVAWYASVIARQLDLAEAETQRIEWAALLHDIGKVAISVETLTKPGTLSAVEYEAVMRHPGLAAEILQDIELLSEVVPYVRAHHERPDGTGYPLGIERAAIPEGALILSVADCFDAMTSSRSYRGALEFQSAVDELRSVAGSQLDERCVEALAAHVTQEDVARLLEGGSSFDV